MCLGDHKGRTKAKGSKNEKFSLPQDLLDIGQKFYKNNMLRLFDILYHGVSQVGFQNFFYLLKEFSKVWSKVFQK